MSQISDSDLNYCREQVCTPAGILTVTHRFLPPDQQAKLLALHALFSAIRSIPFSVSDPGICATKIAWWHQELSSDAQGLSQHPVVRACLALGIFRFFTPPLVGKYLSAWAKLGPGEPIQNLSSMRAMVLEIGAIETALEVEILVEESMTVSLQNMGAALSIAYFLDRFDSKLSGESWWVPLELQARYGVTYSSLENPKHREGLQGACRAIGQLGLGFCNHAKLEWGAYRQKMADSKGIRHLGTCLKIAERRIGNRMANPQLSGMPKPSFAEVFIAWRGAIQ